LTLFLVSLAVACGSHSTGNTVPATERASNDTEPPDPDAATPASGCAKSIDDFCKDNPCPTSVAGIDDYVRGLCTNALPHPWGTVWGYALAHCDNNLVRLAVGEFGGLEFFFDSTTGALRAVVATNDTLQPYVCMGGPATFVEPTTCSGAMWECAELETDAGADASHD
jgi:hypothetical protein